VLGWRVEFNLIACSYWFVQDDVRFTVWTWDFLPQSMNWEFNVSVASCAGDFYVLRPFQGDDCPAMRAGDFFTQTVGGKFNMSAAGNAGDF
jgi:hypothetical protein